MNEWLIVTCVAGRKLVVVDFNDFGSFGRSSGDRRVRVGTVDSDDSAVTRRLVLLTDGRRYKNKNISHQANFHVNQ